jgi:hypothetical protein
VRDISQAMPDLEAKIRHSVGKPYEGEFSVGSRLIPDMRTLGLLIRTRPRGTWRSNLYEYATRSDWLPNIALDSISPRQARAWLVQRYLSAFGPVPNLAKAANALRGISILPLGSLVPAEWHSTFARVSSYEF